MGRNRSLIAIMVAVALALSASFVASRLSAQTKQESKRNEKRQKRGEKREEQEEENEEQGEAGEGHGEDQEKRVKMENLPAAVQQTVREQSKGATIRGLARESKNGVTNYEVELKVNGHSKDVLIAPDGTVVEIEEQVTLDSLPTAVRATIEQNAGGGQIGVIESLTKGGAVVAYEAHIRKAGRSQEIKVDPSGQLISKDRD